MRSFRVCLFALLLLALVAIVGCGEPKKPVNTAKSPNILKPSNATMNSSSIASLEPMNLPDSPNAIPVSQ